MWFRSRSVSSLSKCLVLFLSIAGCAIHPLPDDVTGVPTDTIVRKTRCEARAAIKKSLVDWLLAFPEGSPERRLGSDFKSGARPLQSFSDSLFRGDAQAIVQKFETSAIAYDFTLDITEVNNLDASIDLLKPFRRETHSAALGLGLDRTRQSIRVFTISDTFLGLLTKIKDDYCSIFDNHPDYIYPIVGNIGIAEEVHIFIELTLFNGLAGDPGKPKGPPTMADTLVFTTKLSGSAAPKLVFTPVGNIAHVADATLTADASRTDVHKVVVGLALQPAGSRTSEVKSQSGLFVTVVGTPAQQAAGAAIDQTFLRRGTEARGGTSIIPLE